MTLACSKKKSDTGQTDSDSIISINKSDPNKTIIDFKPGTPTCKALYLFLDTLNQNYITEISHDTIPEFRDATETFANRILKKQFKISIDDVDYKSIKKDDCSVFEKLAEKIKDDQNIIETLGIDKNEFDSLEFVLNSVLYYYASSYDMVSSFHGKYTDAFSYMDPSIRWGLKFLLRPDYYKTYKESVDDFIEERKPKYLYVEYTPEYLKNKLPKFTRIYKINNKEVKDLTYEDALVSLSKTENATLTVSLYDSNTGSYGDLTSVDVDFEAINEPRETTFKIFQTTPKPTIGYFQIPSFSSSQLEKDYLESWVEYMQNISGKTAGVIIDLRNNGGGSVYQMQKILGTIFPDPDTVVGHLKVREKNGYKFETDKVKASVPIDYGKIVVLTNYRSASASEIFASVMKDYGAGLVVGETTIGKGIGQQKFEINHEHISGYAAITNFYTFSPLGESWYLKGVSPHITVTEESYKNHVLRFEDRSKYLPKSYSEKIAVSLDPASIEVKNRLTPEILEKLNTIRKDPNKEPAVCKKTASELAEEESCILSWGLLLLQEWIAMDPAS